jgi:hypothetical protein
VPPGRGSSDGGRGSTPRHSKTFSVFSKIAKIPLGGWPCATRTLISVRLELQPEPAIHDHHLKWLHRLNVRLVVNVINVLIYCQKCGDTIIFESVLHRAKSAPSTVHQ